MCSSDLYEQDKYLCNKFDKEYEAIRGEGEKTRALIENNYVKELRDKIAEKGAEVLTLKQEAFTRAEIGGVMKELAEIRCKMIDKPPLYADAFTPVSNRVERGCDFPRRGRFDDFGIE